MNDNADTMQWRIAEDGFWAGTRNGCFAGTVDRSGTHFYARNQFGEYLGDFADLPRAQDAVEAHLIELQLTGVSPRGVADRGAALHGAA